MNAYTKPFQLVAIADLPAIDPMTKPWLQILYELNHPTDSTQVSDDVLQDLLKKCRLELSGVFSDDEFLVLLNGVFHSRYEPNEIGRLATDLCHDMGVELDEVEQSSLFPFIDRLCSLTREQQLALIDGLQLALCAEEGPWECWKALGIELKAV